MAGVFLNFFYLRTSLIRFRPICKQDIYLENLKYIHCFCNTNQCKTFSIGNTSNKLNCKELKSSKFNKQLSTQPTRNDDGNEHHQPKRSLPMLMDFPEIVWPSILKSIKNFILINFIIQPYLDNEFNLPDFVFGTKQAVQIVSSTLADGDIQSLSDILDPDAIKELKPAVSTMSMTQRSDLRIKKEDIYLSFPYQIGILFGESDEKIQKRWVEITMVFHAFKGLQELQDKGQAPPLNMSVLPEYCENVSICNYRFIKEFTQGCESDWTINIINHFRASDYINGK